MAGRGGACARRSGSRRFQFLPEFAHQKVSTSSDASARTGALVPVKRDATIRDMLTHTAGLADSYMGNVAFFEDAIRITPEDTLETYIKKLELSQWTQLRLGLSTVPTPSA
jgi:CubicO group peptidase (beta-lactamase class C family)